MIRANKYEFYLKQDSVLINTGSTYQVELTPKDSRYFDYLNYNYSIADESVATVDEFGTVTAVGAGETTLKISLSPGFTSKTMKIISTDIDVDNVDVMVYEGDSYKKEDKVNLNVKQSVTVKPKVNDREDINVSGKYHSSDESVAIVDSFGTVTAKAPGTTTITSEVAGVEGEITVEVKDDGSTTIDPPPTTKPTTAPTTKPTTKPTTAPTTKPTAKPTITNIYISPSSMSIKKDSTVQLAAVITPSSLSGSTLTWTSSNTKVATVDKNGSVKGISKGTATITATTSNKLTAKCQITVTTEEVKATKITLNKTSVTLKVSETFQLVATISPSNATVRKLVWSSDNEKVATVNQSGVVKGIAKGSATITVVSSDGKAIAKATVNVQTPSQPTTAPTTKPTTKPTTVPTTKPTTQPTGTISKVEFSIPDDTTKYINDTLQLLPNLKVSPSTVKNYSVTWSSSNSDAISVSSSGTVSFKKAGTATITATVKGTNTVKGQIRLIAKPKSTVTPKPTTTTKPQTAPDGKQFKTNLVQLSKLSSTISKGKTDKFTITVNKAVSIVEITSSNTSVAKVSVSGGNCNTDTNSCMLDSVYDNTSTGKATVDVTITGVGAGTATIKVTATDLIDANDKDYSGEYGNIGVLVK